MTRKRVLPVHDRRKAYRVHIKTSRHPDVQIRHISREFIHGGAEAAKEFHETGKAIKKALHEGRQGIRIGFGKR